MFAGPRPKGIHGTIHPEVCRASSQDFTVQAGNTVRDREPAKPLPAVPRFPAFSPIGPLPDARPGGDPGALAGGAGSA
eukprot:748842-Pyramimonas_sp.AAC.1